MLLCLILSIVVSNAPLGEESFGATPVMKHHEWVSGVVEAANDKHRVYRQWVNGNESFCFRGDAEALNAALVAFGKIDDKDKEIVLNAGQGIMKSFEDIAVQHDWRLHIPSGIYLFMAGREKETHVFTRHPTLHIHVTDATIIDKLVFPKGVPVLGAKDLVKRALAGLASGQSNIASTAAAILGRHHDVPGAMKRLAAMIASDDQEQRMAGACGLVSAGSAALPHLPRLREMKASGSEREKGYLEFVLPKIESAKPMPKKERDARERTAKAIAKRLKAMRPGK